MSYVLFLSISVLFSVSLILIFKKLLRLMESRILLMGNTVEMAGGDIHSGQIRPLCIQVI